MFSIYLTWYIKFNQELLSKVLQKNAPELIQMDLIRNPEFETRLGLFSYHIIYLHYKYLIIFQKSVFS